jgi:hypothetical protein
MKRIVVAVVIVLAGMLGFPPPASAAFWYYPTLPRFASKIIMVENHTYTARWTNDILLAVRMWDVGTDVSIRYGRCAGSYGCVRIYEANAGPTWTGLTTYNYNANMYLYPVKIVLNDYYWYLLSAHSHRQTVFHELGHSFGLTYHSKSITTCMYALIGDFVSMYPNAYDRSVLNYLY